MNIHPHDHIVKSYDEEQRRLVGEILHMGEMAVAQLEAALDVVERRDDRAATRVIANDEAIDRLESKISHDVMQLALRGPMARDLREILAALRVPADIERIGDYAANVAKRSIALNVSPPMPHTTSLRSLGQLAARQVTDVMAAYRDGDAHAAVAVRARDAELDAQYTSLIGDHATNIAENVWFLAHGDAPLPPRDKRDETSTTGAV
jgi:phosphate transport system protein